MKKALEITPQIDYNPARVESEKRPETMPNASRMGQSDRSRNRKPLITQ